MRARLVLGPILVVLLVLGLVLDGVIEGATLPGWLGGSAPAGVVVVPVVMALAIQAARELAVMMRAVGVRASRVIYSLAALAGLIVSTPLPGRLAGADGGAAVASAAGAIVLLAIFHHARHRDCEGALLRIGAVTFAFVYLGLMFGFVIRIRTEHAVGLLVLVLATVKACDIFAYFGGKAVGRRPLVAWLSPGKTWEGLAAGLVGAGLVGGVGLWVLASRGGTPTDLRSLSLVVGAIAGVGIGLAGQLGDLAVSLIKRDAGVKDAGGAVPGFGGVLDLIDSPVLVAPLAYWALSVWG